MSNLQMPKIDRKIIAKKNIIVNKLRKIIKPENVLGHQDELRPL